MTRARTIAWARLGCCPNYATHSYGFHLPQSRLAGPDYSTRTALNRPVGDFCCAVDIGTTTGDARRYVRAMFERWDAGLQPADQAEFIGSPDGRKVLYASYVNPGRVELYRGKGHDVWCHSSKFRALARKDGRWFDPEGPFLGPVLGNVSSTSSREGDALVAVTDAQWNDLRKDVDRLNAQSDRIDDVLSGDGPSWAGSNVKKRLDAIDKKLDQLLASGAAGT
jgi:hypothetical protein